MAPRVLVVEDDSARRVATLTALAGQGYTTLAAASAREAYARVRAGQADGLVVDHTLPDAPGLKLCARLRQDGVGLPLVLTAAPADTRLEAKARVQLGLAGWLPATAEPGEVVKALAAVLPVPPPAVWERGTLAPFALARVFLAAWADGATGTLHLGRGDERRGIELLAGGPVALLPAAPQALVESLTADSRIAPEEAEAFARRPEPSLLVKMGILDPAELVELEQALLEQGLVTLLAWNSGRYVFKAGPVALTSLPPRLDLPRWLFAWMRGVRPAGSGDSFVDRVADRIVAPTASFFEALPFLDPGPFDAPVLAAVEAAGVGAPLDALLRDVASEAGGQDSSYERAGCLDALHGLGLVEVLDAPRPEPLLPAYPRRAMGPRLVPAQLESVVDDSFVDLSSELAGEVAGVLASLAASPAVAAAAPKPIADGERAEREAALKAEHTALAEKNYYEVFGLTPATYRYEAVKEAYFAKLKRFTPDFFVQHGSDGAVVLVAENMVARLATAYNTLSNVVAKENYDRLVNERGVKPTGDKEEDALQAQVQLQSGEAFLARGDFEAAERALTTALALEPTPEVQAHLAWAIFKNPRNRSNRNAIERARGLLTKSLSLKPTADAFAYRGSMFLAEGKAGLAELQFQKALRLSPRHRVASRELVALVEKRAREEKGFFRRLFT
jgi:CheY-like chemotaxis protein/tetratricopeptide (TPR) repeat protein